MVIGVEARDATPDVIRRAVAAIEPAGAMGCEVDARWMIAAETRDPTHDVTRRAIRVIKPAGRGRGGEACGVIALG